MKILDIPKSGRCGDFVFYMRGRKLCRRRYVVPRDPRTPGQLRARAAFGAASKAWSHSPLLTEEGRQAWGREGAKLRSRPRLGQSGRLTGQLHYVGCNCRKGNVEGGMQKAESIPQAVQSQRLSRATREAHPGHTAGAPWQRDGGRGCGRKREGKRARSQAIESKRVARCTREWFRSGSLAPRKQCRWNTGWAGKECRRRSSECRVARWGLAGAGRKGRGRELWRGG